MSTLPGSVNNFVFDQGSVPMCSSGNLVNGFKLNNDVVDPHHLPSTPANSHSRGHELTSSSDSSFEGDSSDNSDVSKSNNVVLKFISEILLEEDLQSKTCMLQDCLALQATEKSFYDALGQKYPPITQFTSPCSDDLDSPDGNSSSVGSSSSYPTATKFETPNLLSSLVDSPERTLMRPDVFSEVKSFGDSFTFASKSSPWKPLMANEAVIPHGSNISESRGKKNHDREESDHLVHERSQKHSAVSLEESELTDIFDKVLLCQVEPKKPASSALQSLSQDDEAKGKLQQAKGSSGRRRSKKPGIDKEVVDLWTLLNQCAQAVASYDQRNAVELMKQITQHSSPCGDGTQRLAHYFVEGLEARLSFTGTPLYSPLVGNRVSAAEILKAHKVYVEACPFRRMSNMFANRTIKKLAEKATKLHIIDFGVAYGFQWPCLIQALSKQPGGPPKLFITGIELPQPGFRPAERVEETFRRLKKYCERFNVPFEYQVIAQKWETIKYEDIKIDSDEMIVVNCLYRLKNIPDDTVAVNSPRETVLKLIKRINPDIFIQGVANGTYNSPFFVTRFREALFHYSALFDIFDATIARDNHQRMLFEKEIWGRDIMNVIACEGSERVERPETYKQWQVKNLRAGFRQIPLDQEIMKEVRSTVKSEYHEDFVVDEDGQWMLQGWKGRIILGLSCWKPVQD